MCLCGRVHCVRTRIPSPLHSWIPSPLSAQVLGHKGDLPDVFVEVEISFYLLKRLLGVKTAEGGKAAKAREEEGKGREGKPCVGVLLEHSS